jgi:hypothetical protein
MIDESVEWFKGGVYRFHTIGFDLKSMLPYSPISNHRLLLCLPLQRSDWGFSVGRICGLHLYIGWWWLIEPWKIKHSMAGGHIVAIDYIISRALLQELSCVIH